MRKCIWVFAFTWGFTSALGAQTPAPKDADPLPKHVLARIGSLRFFGGGHRLCYSPDGKTLAIANESYVRLLNPVSGAELLTFEHRTKTNPRGGELPQAVAELVFFSDGQRLLTGDEAGALRIWNLVDGSVTRLPEQHPGLATLCLAANQESCFTAGHDGVVRRWHLPDGKLQAAWETPRKLAVLSITLYRTPGHRSSVRQVRVGMQGRVATCGQDDTVIIWNADLWKDRAPAPTAKRLVAEDFELFYKLLSQGKGDSIGSAISTLIAGGDGTIAFFKGTLTAAKPAPLQAARAIEIIERIGRPMRGNCCARSSKPLRSRS